MSISLQRPLFQTRVPVRFGNNAPERKSPQHVDPEHPIARALPDTNLKHGVAVVDCGSNALKTIIRLPDGRLLSHGEIIKNGKSIGESGGVFGEALEILRQAFQHTMALLQEYNILPEHTHAVATAGLRSASNMDELVQMAQQEGLKFEVIDGTREAELVYPVTLKGEGIAPDQPVVVIEIGGGSTELAFGVGPGNFDADKSRMLEIGSGRVSLQDPWNFNEVQAAREQARKVFDEELPSEASEWSKDRLAFIKSSDLQDLEEAHKYMAFGDDIQHDDITLEQIDFYLSKIGLPFLEQKMEIRKKLPKFKEIQLISKLVIVGELMRKLDIPRIELGFDGGMPLSLLEQMMNTQESIMREMDNE